MAQTGDAHAHETHDSRAQDGRARDGRAHDGRDSATAGPVGERAALLARARAWRDQDPDEETRAELTALIDAASGRHAPDAAAALQELHGRFDTRLAFGTAGLRGELAAGPNRMNRVLVCQAALGLAGYLLAKADAGGPRGTVDDAGRRGGSGRPDEAPERPSVVIGYDGRKNSDVFARDTAEILAGAGLRAILLPRLLPTPVLAFAVRHLGASAGVMVTASHNPPRDNGYKVYLGDADAGSQIIPPADGEIAAQILHAAETPVPQMPRSTDYEIADDTVVDAYVERAAAAGLRSLDGTPGTSAGTTAPAGPGLRVVYTAMHGVGWQVARRVFARAGLPEPVIVAEQIEPDPTFHTVAFPNPEEAGALDLAFQTAQAAHADLIVANDPDADRLAIAIPAPVAGGYRRLSGNEVGLLLGWELAQRRREAGDTHDTLAVSIVSSPALRLVARHYGLGYAETLTGFKWVSRAPGLLFGFEEALGYLVDPDAVRDKDGISAAAVFVAMACRLAGEGSTIEERLDRFADLFGFHASRQVAIRVPELPMIPAMMARLRQAPPESLGGIAVERIDDLRDGFEGLPPSDVLRILLADGSRVVVRPSGTEPKLKIYVDAASSDGDAAARRAAANARVDALARAAAALVGD